MADRTTELIARNRELLAIAVDACEAARAAIKRAETTVLLMMERAAERERVQPQLVAAPLIRDGPTTRRDLT